MSSETFSSSCPERPHPRTRSHSDNRASSPRLTEAVSQVPEEAEEASEIEAAAEVAEASETEVAVEVASAEADPEASEAIEAEVEVASEVAPATADPYCLQLNIAFN